MKLLIPVFFASLLLFFAQSFSVHAGEAEDVLRACAQDAKVCLTEQDSFWCTATCVTMQNSVGRALHGMRTPQDIGQSVQNMEQDWDMWRGSAMFLLRDAKDMKAYGNLFALQTMCAALRLAAEEWHKNEPGDAQSKACEKARWLEEQCRMMEAPMAQILRLQSYDSGIARRLDIMQSLFAHAECLYQANSIRKRIFARYAQ